MCFFSFTCSLFLSLSSDTVSTFSGLHFMQFTYKIKYLPLIVDNCSWLCFFGSWIKKWNRAESIAPHSKMHACCGINAGTSSFCRYQHLIIKLTSNEPASALAIFSVCLHTPPLEFSIWTYEQIQPQYDKGQDETVQPCSFNQYHHLF